MEDPTEGRPVGSTPMTAVVTGGARGIGEALVERIVGDGGRVVVADVDEAAGRRVVERLGQRARFVHCDVTVEDDVAAAIDVAASWGPLDAVFANAGAVGVTGRIEDHSLADYRSTTDLLLTSVFVTVKHAVRVMRPQRHGAIVCTGSVASVRGGLGPHVYTAAKHAVKGLVESVAVDVVRDGLTINAIAPGGAVTSLAAGLMGDPDDLAAPYARLAAASSSGVPTSAADVAAAALFLARSPRVNGSCLVIDGGDSVLGTAGRESYYA